MSRAADRSGISETQLFTNVFHYHCIVCHGKLKREAGLDLRTRASMLEGGKSGPALVPGSPEKSLVYTRIAADEMPPRENIFGNNKYVRRVRANDIEKLRGWIEAGAPEDSEEVQSVEDGGDTLVSEEDRKFWSLRPPERHSVPDVSRPDLVRTPIDAFLLEKLEEKGLTFAPDADRLTLMRRVYFAATGLPPGPEAIEAYLADRRPEAYDQLVAKLLDSFHYGERWAAFWLDAVGYADTHGKTNRDEFRPWAWRYRDYVIRSLNADKPYDRFLVEQIAGDELFDFRSTNTLTPEQKDCLIATGFLRTAADDTDETGFNFAEYRMAVVNDQVQIFSSALLGLTMDCARCHDHKFDPLPQRDYYRFAAIFRSAFDPYDWRVPSVVIYPPPAASVPVPYQRLITHPGDASPAMDRHNQRVSEQLEPLKKSFEESRSRLVQKLRSENLVSQEELDNHGTTTKNLLQISQRVVLSLDDGRVALRDELQSMRLALESQEDELAPLEKRFLSELKIYGVYDLGGDPTPVYVLNRGDWRSPTKRVAPGVPVAIREGIESFAAAKPDWDTSGQRLGLARWMTQPNHPLTARVLVNRIWQHHFGRGIVGTPGNFGETGLRPSHPKLLDWLATEFVRRGWSQKELHRMILTSTVYRQRSLVDEPRYQGDPDNTCLSRFPFRRLEAEAIRDSVLKVAGRLDLTPFGPADEVSVAGNDEVKVKETGEGGRRSVYVVRRRKTPVTMLELFDAPRVMLNCLRRPHSTVAPQALQLWNSSMMRSNARRFAGRVRAAVGGDVRAQIDRIYLESFCRQPTRAELDTGTTAIGELRQYWMEHFQKQGLSENADLAALSAYCHTILNSPEFLYVD